MNSNEMILAVREGYGKNIEQVRECAKWGYNVVSDGVAVISIESSLSDIGFFGMGSYTTLRSAIEQCLNLDECKSILLEINSPGGEVGGLFECTSFILEAKKQKPIHAHITGMCCSAAYAIASACTSISATDTSEVGSVGVFAMAYDFTEHEKKQGILSRIFRSKNADKKNLSAFSEEGAKDLQEKLDFFEGKFYDLLSEGRGIDKEKCIEDFGHGSVFLASDALSKGMIDEISSFEDSLSNLASSDKEEEGEDMDIAKLSAEEKMQVFNALISENPSLLAEAEGKAAEREKERITSLLSLKSDGNAEIIDKAVSEGKKAEDIAMDLYRCEKERADKMAANSPNLSIIAKQAENDQNVSVQNPMPHDLGAEADKIAKTVSAARK